MKLQRTLAVSSFACVAWALSAPASAQALFSSAPAQIPATGSFTENVDFGDVDLDGDWDVAVADGGDSGNDQNRLYVNQGHLQGGPIGTFLDKTALQLPVVSDDSRDIDFVDFDGDGDLDQHSSNTAELSNQSNRWWTNQGGIQGGTAGFYVDETLTRWTGLGVAPSSVSPFQVLPGGGFIDWTGDSEFADLDSDGDLDLVHSSTGGSFSGSEPTRLFLNDGLGHFAEFNPGGWPLAGTGTGLWCQGMHVPGTTDVTGAQCDIAENAMDVDTADVDGDLDLDILLGSWSGKPRLFQNRLTETGALAFVDVTGAPATGAFPMTFIHGEAHEFADIDGDDDADLAGMMWTAFPGDVALSNAGTGKFASASPLPTTGTEHTEGDFFDFDADGDLDMFLAAWSTAGTVLERTPGSYTALSPAAAGLPALMRSLDVDLADVDEDGDYDAVTAEDAGQHEKLLLNQKTANDTTAPRFAHLQALADQLATPGSLAVRAQVYDNSPYYQAWFDDVAVEVSVNGCPLPPFAAESSYGQVFRAEIPKNLVGQLAFVWTGTDEHGNTGVSAQDTYLGSNPLGYASHFGAGSPGSLGVPQLEVGSVPFAGTTLYLIGKLIPPGAQWLLGMTTAAIPGAPLALPGLCNLNVAGSILFTKGGQASALGCAVVPVALPATVPAGVTAYVQFFAFDGVGGNLLSSTDGVALTTQ